MSTDRDAGVTRIPVECPLCHEMIDARSALIDHLRVGHPKRELAAFVERNYEEFAD